MISTELADRRHEKAKARKKKQVIMIAVLSVGLVIAVFTAPDAPEDVSTTLVVHKPEASVESKTAPLAQLPVAVAEPQVAQPLTAASVAATLSKVSQNGASESLTDTTNEVGRFDRGLSNNEVSENEAGDALSRRGIDEILATPLFGREATPQVAPIQKDSIAVNAIYGNHRGRSALMEGVVVRSGKTLPFGSARVLVHDRSVRIAQ